jgi:hypothetical protein
MTDAEKLFNEAHARWLYAWSVVSNFRNVFSNVADTVALRLHAQTEAVFQKLIGDPDYKGILLDPDRFAKSLDPKIVQASSNVILEGSYGSLDAASLVFFHSALDAAAFDFCCVTALHAPTDWEPDIESAKISIQDAKNPALRQTSNRQT